MLTVSGLSKSYGKQVLFEDVSFQVAPGERVGLVGRNGHGKTTLFRILLGEESADGGTIAVPSGYRIGHLAQRLEFLRPTVLEEAASALPRREDGTDETYKAKAVLAGLGFDEADLGRAPAGLSGGFQVRLNLARVLVSTPDLLLLDEPTNYLDIVSIRWLRRFLCAWKGALILVTHDRDFMDSVTTHTMAIHRCRVRKLAGGTEKLYAQILQEETIHEQTRLNDERRRKEAEAFINRLRAQAAKAKAVQSRIKLLARHERLEKLAEIRDLDFRFAEAPFAGKWMLEARGLSFRYDPARPLIEGFSLSVARGDRIAVVGPNGKGKTTLLRLLAGELSPASGAVKTSANVKIGYFGQTNVDRLQPAFSIEEEVRQGNPSLTRTQVRNLCGAMMFGGDAAEKRVSVLSGGERSRVLLAKILASPVNLLLLDEPTNHLDLEAVQWLEETLRKYRGTVLVISHDRYFMNAVCDSMAELSMRRLTQYEGNYDQFAVKRQADLERQLKEYKLRQAEIARQQAIIQRYRMYNREKSIRAAESREKRLEKIERLDRPASEQRVRFSFEARRRTGEDVLKAKGLSKAFEGRALFRDFHLHLRAGDRVALIGPNGVGKTTLLNILARRLAPDSGTVEYGANVDLGYYEQHQSGLDPEKDVLNELWDAFPRLELDRVRSVLALFLLTGDDVYQKISTLSGGEKGRVSLAKLMLKRDNLLLLDEPTNHLDMDSREVLEGALEDFDGTILAVSHDRYFINRIANRVIEMRPDGVSEYLGNYDDYLEKKRRADEAAGDETASGMTRTQMEKLKRRERLSRESKKALELRLKQQEKSVEDAEAEIARLEARMGEPELYQNPDEARQVAKRHSEAKAALEELLAEWEELYEAIGFQDAQ